MPSFEERPAEDAAGSVGEYDTAIEDDTRVQDRQEIEEFRRNLDWALEEVRHCVCYTLFSRTYHILLF